MNDDNILRARGINPASILGRRLKRAGLKGPELEKVVEIAITKEIKNKEKKTNVKGKKSKEEAPKTS